MPEGAVTLRRKTVRVSATLSPSASRSKVMRFALGAAPPAFFWNFLKKYPRIPLLSSGRAGALVSATSTSPLGSTYTQRGCSSPCAKATTDVPSAAMGFPAGGQPLAATTLTRGMRDLLGGGNEGWAPWPALT